MYVLAKEHSERVVCVEYNEAIRYQLRVVSVVGWYH